MIDILEGILIGCIPLAVFFIPKAIEDFKSIMFDVD